LGLPSRREEHSAGRAVALDLRDDYLGAWFREAEALDQRPADVRLRAIAAWDASACAHRDGAAAALYRGLQGLHRQRADGAEKLVDRARDVPGPASCLQLELPAAPEAARGGSALCKQALGQFAERSSAAPVAAGGSDALESKRLKAQEWKLKQALQAFVPVEEAQPDVAARLREWLLPEQQRLGAGPRLAVVQRLLEEAAAWAL